MKKRFMIVGLGILGRALAKTLSENGCEVIAVDESRHEVELIKDFVSVAAECDATDAKALKQLGCSDLDAAVVCIGEQFESAVLATAHLLDLGVRFVAARANSPVEESILKRLGAHEIFSVESSIGKILGDKFANPSVLTEMTLEDGYKIIQWEATKKIDAKSLVELKLPATYGVQVVAIKGRADGAMQLPTAESVICNGDRVLILGNEEKLRNFLNHWKE